MARHDMTLRHVGDVAAVSFTETDQHTTLTWHQTHRQPGAVAVAPGRPVHGWKYGCRLELANVAESILQHTLLHGYLGPGIEMLHGTATTDAKVGAARFHPLGRSAQHPFGTCLFVGRFASNYGGFDAFARQRTLDKNHLAITVRNAPRFEVERLDVQYFYTHDWGNILGSAAILPVRIPLCRSHPQEIVQGTAQKKTACWATQTKTPRRSGRGNPAIRGVFNTSLPLRPMRPFSFPPPTARMRYQEE